MATDGVISDYSAYGLFENTPESRLPAGPAISRAAALAKAAEVLKAAHLAGPLAPPQAQEANTSASGQREGHLWMVVCQRQAQGIPFLYQQATVQLQAETGDVVGMGIRFPVPPPSLVKARLTRVQAVSAGLAALKKQPSNLGEGAHPTGTPTLVWLSPETQMITTRVNGVANNPLPPIPAAALPARLCWLCRYVNRDNTGIILPIDALTGAVISSGVGIGYPPIHVAPGQHFSAMPPPAVAPDPVLPATIAMTTLPQVNHDSPPPGVPRYRLTLTDIFASISALSSLGFDTSGGLLLGNEETDPTLGQKLENAAQAGRIVVMPGPSAVVADGGVWGLTRTRAVLCQSPIYWSPSSVPAQIGMTFSITPILQPDGRIQYRYELGLQALATGQSLTPTERIGGQVIAWSWGEPGETTLLGSTVEEWHASAVGTLGHPHVEGISHILLIQGTRLP